MPPTTAPTKTDTPTAPTKRDTPQIDPDRHYQPERLCPDQRGDGERWARP
jgi:hypothetical protein